MSIFFSDRPCLDPLSVAEACARERLPMSFVGRANSFLLPLGTAPGRGWVLLTSADLDALDLNALHVLRFENGSDAPVVLSDLVIADDPTCLTPGHEDDTRAAYLVELADARHLAANRFYANPLTQQYNVRAPAGGKTWYADTVKANDTPYTWQQLLDHIWGWVDVSQLGASPSLPFAPHGTPENFQFNGVPAWEAYNEVLTRLGCAFKFDPTAAAGSRSSIVRLGADDPAFEAAHQAHRKRHWNAYPKQVNRGSVPSKVKVFFPRVREHYGSEKSTGWDAGQQDVTNPLHAVTVSDPGGTEGVQTASVAALFDDMAALIDFSGTVTNTAALNARANQRAADYYRSLHSGATPMHRRYAGWLKATGFMPGPQVSGIAWLDVGAGWITEVIRHPPLRRVGDDGQWAPWRGTGRGVSPQLQPPDLGRQTHALYPPLGQSVQVTGAAVATNVYPGVVLRVDPSGPTPETRETCWIYSINGDALASGDKISNARLYGTFTHSSSKRPIYGVNKGGGGTTDVALIRADESSPSGGCGRHDAMRVVHDPQACTYTDAEEVWLVQGATGGGALFQDHENVLAARVFGF